MARRKNNKQPRIVVEGPPRKGQKGPVTIRVEGPRRAPSNRRRNRRRGNPGLTGQTSSRMNTPGGFNISGPMGLAQGRITNGVVRYRDTEFWKDLAVNRTVLTFYPGTSEIVKLDQFGNMFELWHLNSATVRYVPAVGTTSNGLIILGIDYDPSDLPTTQAGVQALTNCFRTPVWQPQSFKIDVSRVNKTRNMYTASGPGTHGELGAGFSFVAWNTGPASAGQIYVDYDISFSSPTGPQNVALSSQALVTLSWSTNVAGTAGTTNPIGAPADMSMTSTSGGVPATNALANYLVGPAYGSKSGFSSLAKGMFLAANMALRANTIYTFILNLNAEVTGTLNPGSLRSIFGDTPEIYGLTSPRLMTVANPGSNAPTPGTLINGIYQMIRNHDDPAGATSLASSQFVFRFQPAIDYLLGDWGLQVPLHTQGFDAIATPAYLLTAAIATVGASVRTLTPVGITE